eukprot:2990_1
MATKTKHYCSCNPKSKPAAEREEAKWYCFRHRRHLCDNCIYDELNQRHISCLVGTYDEFIQSPPTAYAEFKQNKCPLCKQILPDDDARSVVRLNCACVYHANCLQQYLLSYSSNNVQCASTKCTTLITSQPTTKRTNLGYSVEKFLRSVSKQRLWNKPKHGTNTAPDSGSPNVMNETETTQIIEQKPKPKHTGHIVLDTRDMTRHRTVQASLNRDGNKEDDKYHKPIRRRRGTIKSKSGGWSTRKILVVLLLCCALIAQGCFLYMLFGSKSGDSKENVQIEKQKIDVNKNIEGMVNNLPPRLKQEILGNKLKYQNLQKRLID